MNHSITKAPDHTACFSDFLKMLREYKNNALSSIDSGILKAICKLESIPKNKYAEAWKYLSVSYPSNTERILAGNFSKIKNLPVMVHALEEYQKPPEEPGSRKKK